MKNKKTANETDVGLGLDVFGVAYQGRLAAYVLEQDGRYKVLIVSQDFPDGDPVPTLDASDIEDLAKLTAAVAEVLHHHSQLAPGLRDDLGCLAHTLTDALGVQFQQSWVPAGGVQ